MLQTRILMGMPITVEVADRSASPESIERAYAYFGEIDRRFSTYKPTSEISRINAGTQPISGASPDMRTVLALAEQTKRQTHGYFDVRRPDGTIDPSGLVKGWAIYNAAKLLEREGLRHFYVEAGGDLQTKGRNAEGQDWSVGIRNPFDTDEIVKVVSLKDQGMATSGTYVRGQHIYDPHDPRKTFDDILSLTVIGPNVYEADRFATAAFAMGPRGIEFIERMPGCEAYMIDRTGTATMTSGFESLVLHEHAATRR